MNTASPDPSYGHLARTSDSPIGLEVVSAEGPYILLADGSRVVDMISGIAVSSLGHGNARVAEAINRQVALHLHVMVYGEFVLRPQVEFAELLASQLPESLQVVYLTMTGTEANEGALKLAKKYTGRSGLVAFERSYHGDTHGSLSVTGRDVYRTPFEPLLPGVTFLPFDDVQALRGIGSDTACVIVEPIQGEGGIRVPSGEWMRQLRERCNETGALLIFDEIQTGFGRTGSLFAFERFGVIPDVLTLAKAMGGGMPLGAFVASEEIMATLRSDPPLAHVTTFGGHPVSCAAARAALEVLLEERLPARALEIERRIRQKLKHPLVPEVRGRGAMLGLQLPDCDKTATFVRRCLEQRVLLGWTLHSDTLVRVAPPLNIPFEVLDDVLSTMITVLDEVAGRSIHEPD